MTLEQRTILSLIRINISGNVESLPIKINWSKVINEAAKQGVLGFCFDSIGLLQLEQRPDVGILFEWFGLVEYQKTQYHHLLDIATEFADNLCKRGVRISVLKGFAFSRYYRHPELRYSCDFDCYLSDWEKGNEIAQQLGAAVDKSEQKHSHIRFKSVHIENHRECTGVSEEGFERYISSMLFLSHDDKITGTNLELPPLIFDALLCIYHARTHFLVENSMQLKHVVDWIHIKRELIKRDLYDVCIDDCKKYAMSKFLASLNDLADFVEKNNSQEEISYCSRLMMEDILANKFEEKGPKGWFFDRFSILKHILQNSWKYKLYTDTSSKKVIFQYLKRFAYRILIGKMLLIK